MAKLTWLHLSDLHRGQRGSARWNHHSKAVLADMKRMARKHGPPEIILMTGDLAFSGSAEEYDLVDTTVSEICDALGAEPLVFPVPGNHDLIRPDARPITRCGLKSYMTDNAIRRGLQEDNVEVCGIVASLFSGYTAWLHRSVIPAWRRRGVLYELGAVPGTFRATSDINGILVGILGLNSAYLHLDNDPSSDRCELVVEHEHAGTDFSNWYARREANLLLMHHPLDWLVSDQRRTFKELIYPQGAFVACFYGHMHASGYEEVGDGRGPPRRFFQAPSLLGLERYGTSQEIRSCGYAWGCLETRQPQKGTLKRWSRKYSSDTSELTREDSHTDKKAKTLALGARRMGPRIAIVSISDPDDDLRRSVAVEVDRNLKAGDVLLVDGKEGDAALLEGVGHVIMLVGASSTFWGSPVWTAALAMDPILVAIPAAERDCDTIALQFRSGIGSKDLEVDPAAVLGVVRAKLASRLGQTSRHAPLAGSTIGDPASATDALLLTLRPINDRAKSYFDSGDFVAALGQYRQVVTAIDASKSQSHDHTDAAAKGRLNIAACLLNTGDAPGALTVLEKLDETSMNPKLRVRFAMLLAYCGDLRRARAVLPVEPSEDANRVLQLIEIQDGLIPAQLDSELRLDAARILVQQGRLRGAVSLVLAVLNERPV